MVSTSSTTTTLAFLREATFGVAPATPAFQLMRWRDHELATTKEAEVTEEITGRPDAAEQVLLSFSGGGPINFPLTFGDADTAELLAIALRSAWTAGAGGDDLEDLVAGALQETLTFEDRTLVGGVTRHKRFPKSVINGLTLAFPARQRVTGSFDVLSGREDPVTTPLAGATYAPVNTGGVMRAASVANLAIGGVSGQIFLQDLTLNIQNNITVIGAVGDDDVVSYNYGERAISGTISALLTASTIPMYDQFLAHTASSLAWECSDTTDAYGFSIPRIKFTEAAEPKSGPNETLIVNLSFAAEDDPSGIGAAMKLTRTAAGA